MSVQAAIENHQELTSNPILGWPQTWIPVFEFEGEWYAVECGPDKILGSPVIHFFIEDEPATAYLNLTLYMEVMSDAMHQGALRWDGQWRREDLPVVSQIHKRLNPAIGFPYHVAE
ncbi:MAG: hypothetical protein QNJ46_19100 [Leptolyngbyaceae cyanobacterium MO_188.B28]|nr:hypothetical protein [Leptolyngbyaceae cyanobacterium MO_188.B28]